MQEFSLFIYFYFFISVAFKHDFFVRWPCALQALTDDVLQTSNLTVIITVRSDHNQTVANEEINYI